jgi:hypothetical protein
MALALVAEFLRNTLRNHCRHRPSSVEWGNHLLETKIYRKSIYTEG